MKETKLGNFSNSVTETAYERDIAILSGHDWSNAPFARQSLRLSTEIALI